MLVCMFGLGSSLWGFGWRLGCMVFTGVLARTSLLAKDGFFLLGLVAKLWLSVGSEETRCQFLSTLCLISGLLSLYFIGITSGCVSLLVFVDDSRIVLFLNWLIWPLISVALYPLGLVSLSAMRSFLLNVSPLELVLR